MAKKLNFSADLPYSVEELFALASSEECIRAKAEYLEHREVEVSDLRNAPGEPGGVVVSYQVDTKVGGAEGQTSTSRNSIVETVTWTGPATDGSREYRFEAVVKGVPAVIHGKVTMTPLGPSETRNAAAIDVNSRVPLIGWRIESLLETQLTHNFEGEISFIKEWMASHA